MQNNSKASIKYRIIVPLGVVLAVILATCVLGINTIQNQTLNNNVEDNVQQFDNLFNFLIENEAVLIESQLDFLLQDQTIIDSFTARDRDALLNHTKPIFEHLNTRYGITHFYFSDTDRVNFLRVHNPSSNGDTINRFTTLEAERTGQESSGIEIGQSGLFTLRVVEPWTINGELLGYMELGIEIDHLIGFAQSILSSELIIMVNKPNLDRASFEAGMQKIGREVVWDEYRDAVTIIDTLGLDLTQEQITTITTEEGAQLSLEKEAKHYRFAQTPFINVAGESVGFVLIGNDTTQTEDELSNLSRLMSLGVLMIGLFLTAMFYIYLNRIENQQNDINEQLWLANRDIESSVQSEQAQREALQEINNEVERRARTEQKQREQLLGLIGQIQKLMGNLNATVAEIQVSATQQLASAAEQNTAITQTAATVEEIRSTVQQTASHAGYVSDSAQNSIEISRRGQAAVSNSIQGMQLIQGRVEDIARTILDLSERTQQISDIINTVAAIADQSKLLALNASIEAARAGEEGRGFAVVAMEVRELAEQSRKATAHISTILNDIQQTTNTAVMVTEEGSKEADTGMGLAEKVSMAIQEVATALEDMGQTAVQIAASTQQQINGMDQLVTAMTQIKQAGDQSANSSRQAVNSMRELMEMAQELESMAMQYTNGDLRG